MTLGLLWLDSKFIFFAIVSSSHSFNKKNKTADSHVGRFNNTLANEVAGVMVGQEFE